MVGTTGDRPGVVEEPRRRERRRGPIAPLAVASTPTGSAPHDPVPPPHTPGGRRHAPARAAGLRAGRAAAPGDGQRAGARARHDARRRAERRPDRARVERVGGARRRRRPARAADPPRGRAARDGAGAHRHPALGRREGQPVLRARLQPRPRHRLPDAHRGRAAQHADARPRPGLHRPQPAHPRAGGLPRLQARRAPRRARGLLERGRRGVPPRGLARAPVRDRGVRRARAGAPRRRRLAARRRGDRPRRRRGEGVRRALGPAAGAAEARRRRARHVGPRHVALLAARHGLPQRVERERPDPAPRRRAGRHLALRAARLDERRRGGPLQPLRELAAPRRALDAGGAALRRALRPRPLLELRLLPRRSRGRRPVRAVGPPHDPRRQRHARAGRRGARRRARGHARAAGARGPHRRRRTRARGGPRARGDGARRPRAADGRGPLRGGGVGVAPVAAHRARRARRRLRLRRAQRPRRELGRPHRGDRQPEGVAGGRADAGDGALPERRLRLPQQRRARHDDPRGPGQRRGGDARRPARALARRGGRAARLAAAEPALDDRALDAAARQRAGVRRRRGRHRAVGGEPA